MTFFLHIILGLMLWLPTPHEFKQVHSSAWENGHLAVDPQGNVLRYSGDMLEKYSPDGTASGSWNAKGTDITFVDASNPLRILVWYADQRQIVTLDNTLSEHDNMIVLDQSDLDQVSLVCASANNRLWLFDQANLEVLRVSRTLQIENRSGQLATLLDREVNPTQMTEQHEQLFVLDPETGVMVFDIFGTYLKTLPLKGATFIQPLDEHLLLYVKDQTIYLYNQLSLETTVIEQPVTEATEMIIHDDKTYVNTGHSIDIFQKLD